MKRVRMMKNRAILLFTLLIFNSALLQAEDLSESYVWKPMKIGGGGWVVGMDISPTEKDLVYVRADVSGAYRWNAATSTWKQLVTDASMPSRYVAYGKYQGVDSLVSAPKNPEIAYMAFQNQIFKSVDRGDNWAATGFGNYHVMMEPNGEGRQAGERLAVDPHNSDVVYYAPITGAPWITSDGGVTWSQITGIPGGVAPHGVTTVVFDKDSGTVDGSDKTLRTKTIYVTVDRAGVFQSTDGGKKWAKLSESEPGIGLRLRDAEVGPDRSYYVVCDDSEGATGLVWKYTLSGSWVEITPPSAGSRSKAYWDISVDPTDGNRIIVMVCGGQCFVSNNQGESWTSHSFQLESADVEWHARQNNFWLSVGELAFDPFDSGKLWFAEGFGVWWTRDLTSEKIPWHSVSMGIEEACGNDIIAPPGGKPLAAMWDISTFYFTDSDSYNAKRGFPAFMSCWALDWCPADPSFIVGVFQNHLNLPPQPRSSGYSRDGGQTWTRFAGMDDGKVPDDLIYGAIAVSANSKDNIVWCAANGKLPFFTKDRGVSWQPSECEGLSATAINGYWSAQKPLCADRVLADTFYLYVPDKGIYRSTDGGGRFTKIGEPICPGGANAILKAIPGKAGDLWFSEGANGGLWHSTNGGLEWTRIAPFEASVNVGFGKSLDADGYPAIYVVGTIKGQHGIYRSNDAGGVWDKIGDYPLGIFDWIDAIDGDKTTFGKVYLAFAQAGFAYGELKASPVPGKSPNLK